MRATERLGRRLPLVLLVLLALAPLAPGLPARAEAPCRDDGGWRAGR